MELRHPALSFLLLFSLVLAGSEGSDHRNDPSACGFGLDRLSKRRSCGFNPTKLFVFGDSYADTGNGQKSLATSWKAPYGITFPGKPSGRFSDGRVLTDFLAKFLGMKSPTPYEWRAHVGKKIEHGMNFAFGGAGVFDTIYPVPNMTAQIDFFEKLIAGLVYKETDLEGSLGLVAISGNDYDTYLARGGKAEGLPSFISSVVKQLVENAKRIRGLGVSRVVLTSLQPLGCLPQSTIASSYRQCNDTDNTAVGFHNSLLQQAVASLNNASKGRDFLILDLYSSFTTVLFKKKEDSLGSMKFETPLKPCCEGIGSGNSCGSVGQNGEKLFTVCGRPRSSFFWDTVHPTQSGWRAVVLASRPNLRQIYKT